MRASPLLGGFLSVFVSSAGCSLLTSTTDLSGAGHGGVPSDAGAEGAPLEGSAGDGAADAIAARFCDATAHAFCADFEAVVSVTDGWTDSRQEVGGTVSLSDMPSPGRDGAESFQLELGALGYNVPAPSLTLHYDNVTIDFP